MRRVAAAIATALAVALVTAAGLVWLWPGFGLALSLALPAAERWITPLASEPRREEATNVALGRPLRADLYRPAAPRGALVLVHGLSRAGRRHPALERLAWLLARRGQLVLVPHFEGLATFRLDGDLLQEIEVWLADARRRHGGPGIVGFSFGAGPALVAAARTPGLRVVGSFGGYADLGNVITFVTTGVHRLGDRTYRERQEAYNRWKLLALLSGLVGDPHERPRVEAIAARRLADPSDDTRELEAALGPDGRAVLALIRNRSEERVPELLAALPRSVGSWLIALSPLASVSRITGRLVIVHGAGDDSIPFTESLRLAAARPGSRLVVLETFHHTGPQSVWGALAGRLRDGWALARVADDLVSQR